MHDVRQLAIYATMQALVGEGDEVILMEPFYDSYPAAVTLAGARPVFVPLRQRAPYAACTLSDALSDAVKASPHRHPPVLPACYAEPPRATCRRPTGTWTPTSSRGP